MMWKIGRSLAVCIFAAAWWGIFYPELCFSEGTCAVVWTENSQKEDKEPQRHLEEIDATAVWQASGDEIVISSRLWEWCEENLRID